MKPAWIALIVTGASFWAAAAELPQEAPATSQPSSSKRLSLYIQAINDSPDPSVAIQSYARAQAVGGDDVGIQRVYLRRMVDFGLPEMADAQARDLVKRDPDNGLAWGVAAYMNAKRGDTTAALAEIVPAARKMPHDAFVLRTAGQLLAWYDTEADQADLDDSVKRSVESIRGELAKRPVYSESYRQTKEAYQRLATAAASQPAEAFAQPPEATATQPAEEPEAQAYPPVVVPYNAPSEPVQQPYGATYAYPYAESYPTYYPYFAGSYPSWYPSYYYSSAWWWPSYSWWWPAGNFLVYPHYPRALLAFGALRHGFNFLHHHGFFHRQPGLLIPSHHGFGFVGGARYGGFRGYGRGYASGQYFRPGGYPRFGTALGSGSFGFRQPGFTGAAPRVSPQYRAGTGSYQFRSPVRVPNSPSYASSFRSPVRVPSSPSYSYNAGRAIPRATPQYSARSFSSGPRYSGSFRSAPMGRGGFAPRAAPMGRGGGMAPRAAPMGHGRR